MLSEIGDDGAKLVLAELDTDVRTQVVREALADAIGGRAEEPLDLGLDARGEATVDLGGRTVRVVLAESLVPRVVLPDGRRVAQMPRAGKGDDPARVASATARFNRLRHAAHTIARTEVARLERAMVTSRRFNAAHLVARWSRHALLAQAARRVVWGVFSGPSLVGTFRVAEDGSYADADDLPFALDDDASIGVVHPLDLDAPTRERWGTIFGDYEILQPFEQLGRIAFAASPAEAAAVLAGIKGAMVPARSLLRTLETHGWARPAARRIASAWRELRGTKPHLRALVTFAPGIDLTSVRTAPPQKLGGMNVSASPGLEDVDPLERSELVRTALTLRG